MKALITGSNGFLGSALVQRLIDHGAGDVYCFVRRGANRARLESIQRQNPNVTVHYVEGTLGSTAQAAKAIEGFDTILHLAAAPNGQPADIFLNSVVCSKHLLEAALAQPTPPKIVLVSSFGVYGTAGRPRGAVLDEHTPLEPNPTARDIYSQAKLRQEQLFWEYRARQGYPLVVLRPGVIYGPTGGRLSGRIGVQLPGLFLELGHRNVLPLSYVDNCAEAIVVAAERPEAVGQVYNVHDDDLPTCHEYFVAFQRAVSPIRSLPVPYPVLLLGSRVVEAYHRYSGGQLPDIFTPYKTRTMWKGQRFSNDKLKSLGWRQVVSTQEGMRRTFEYFAKQERKG